MIQEGATVIGAVLAISYALTIGSILWWMLHVPSVGDIESQVKRIQREEERFARIVVPVMGEAVSNRLLALASQMAGYRGATMDVLYVVEVPLTLPIDAVTDEQRERAEETFARAEKVAAKYDVKINKRMRLARQAGPSIAQYAAENGADFVLMSDVPKSNHRGTRYARSVEYVFEHAPCEVIIDRPPME